MYLYHIYDITKLVFKFKYQFRIKTKFLKMAQIFQIITNIITSFEETLRFSKIQI